jgi:dsRNA-specific ribonuclease
MSNPYYGIRGDKFRELIRNILSLGKMKKHYIDMITDEEGMKMYDMAFTHYTIDENNNYEFIELLGDSTLNKSVVWYVSRRFPELGCAQGVKILARLKINLVSKEIFAGIATKLGLWDFISADVEIRQTKMKPLLEDVLEAFFGTTEYLLDKKMKNTIYGTGYAICYQIISKLLDNENISLKYEDLYDNKTRLKETLDMIRAKIRKEKDQVTYQYNPHSKQLVYVKSNTLLFDYLTSISEIICESTRNDTTSITNIYVNINTLTKSGIASSHKIYIGSGNASLKPKSEQNACGEALTLLRKWGIIKPVPEIYKSISN